MPNHHNGWCPGSKIWKVMQIFHMWALYIKTIFGSLWPQILSISTQTLPVRRTSNASQSKCKKLLLPLRYPEIEGVEILPMWAFYTLLVKKVRFEKNSPKLAFCFSDLFFGSQHHCWLGNLSVLSKHWYVSLPSFYSTPTFTKNWTSWDFWKIDSPTLTVYCSSKT